jgi:hypothetical protein
MKKVFSILGGVIVMIVGLMMSLFTLSSPSGIFGSIFTLVKCIISNGNVEKYSYSITLIVLNIVFIFIIWFIFKFGNKLIFKNKRK